jgi:Mce-associated membrane protein
MSTSETESNRVVEGTDQAGSAAPVETAPAAAKPVAEEPVAAKPAVEEPVAEQPVADEPAVEKAVDREPAPSAAVPPVSTPTAGPAGRFPLTLSKPVAIAVAATLVVAVAAAVTFGVLLVRRAAVERASNAALATARAYAVTVTSYDYQHLDRNFADVLDGATGEFKDQYAGASKTLRELITQVQATARGTVVDAGVESASTDRVVVVLFVDQAITNSATPQPRRDRNRVVMTLTARDGRWLVSRLELK